MTTKKRRPRRYRAPGLPIRQTARKAKSIRRSSPRRRKFSALIVLGLLALSFITVCCYLWMNQKVSAYLSASNHSYSSTIYYRPRKIYAAAITDLTEIANYLQEIGYHATKEIPKIPGEFQRGKNWLKLYSREFGGESENYSAAILKLSPGKIESEKTPDLKEIFLEPKILKQLEGEQKEKQFVPLGNIPKQVVNAVLASEDHRFYSHFGVDIIGMLRATLTNLLSLRFSQGGSTITQQLVKNTLLYPRKTLLRKYLEILAAISLENKLNKDRILELYLNEVYLGQEGATAIHGLNAASRTFFDKNVEELKLHEAALLAGIIKAPSYYSPRRHHTRAIDQRNLVLSKLHELAWISDQVYQSELKQTSKILPASRSSQQQNYFIEYIQRELATLDLPDAQVQSEVKIVSGLDSQIQNCGTAAITSGLAKLRAAYPRLAQQDNDLQASLVAMEPISGMIRAWVGGSDFGKSQFDRVWQSQRQIGSLAKPFVYLTALDATLNDYPVATADSILLDDQVRIELAGRKIWEPKNYDHKYRGRVTLRYALENSLNVPTVYLSQALGLSMVGQTFMKFGLSKNSDILPSTVLGSLESTLLSVTAAYSALANGGRYIKPRAFSRVYNDDQNEIIRSEYQEKRVSDEAATFVLTNILQGVIERGTGKTIRALGFSPPAAGKTGTTNELRDAWFIGFTPTLVAGVWVGLDSNKPLGLTGALAAAPIWAELMNCASASNSKKVAPTFIPPRDVITRLIDSQTGSLAVEDCPTEQLVREVYVAGTEPKDLCSLHAD